MNTSIIKVISLLILLASFKVHSAVVMMDHFGEPKRGRVGEIYSAEFIFYTDKEPFHLNAGDLISIRVDESLKGKELEADIASVKKVQLISQTSFHQANEIKRNVKSLLYGNKYDELEKLGDFYLSSLERLDNGFFKLYMFYDGFKRDIKTRNHSDLADREAKILQWINSKPDSIHAKIALIKLKIKQAWGRRGSGFSNTVSKESWEGFRVLIDEAMVLANQLLADDVKNPELYRAWLVLMKATSGSKELIKDVAIKSLDEFPSYYGVYMDAYQALLPRWGGRSGELPNFFKKISLRLEDLSPEAAYLSHIGTYNGYDVRDYADAGFDWELIKRSFSSYEENFQVNESRYHRMAMLACLQDDKKGAREYFSKVSGDWNYLAREVWSSQEKYNIYKSFSEEIINSKSKEFRDAVVKSNIPLVSDLLSFDPELIDVLIKQDLYGETPLHYLAEKDRYQMIKLLGSAVASFDPYNEYGMTPLHVASRRGNALSVRALIESGADYRKGYSSDENFIAAHEAAARGFVSVLNVLFEYDLTQINAKDEHGYRPFHNALYNNQIDVLKYLIELDDQQLNYQKASGFSAVHYAVHWGRLDLVETLVELGADFNLKTVDGYTPLALAKARRYADIVKYLVGINAQDGQVLVGSNNYNEALSYHKKAASFYNEDGYLKAAELYLKSVELYPMADWSFQGLGNIALWYQNDAALAVEYYQKALDINPDNPEYYYWLGRAYVNLGDVTRARNLFDQYLELSPDSYNALDLKENWAHYLSFSEEDGPADVSLGQIHGFIFDNFKVLLLFLFSSLFVLIAFRFFNKSD